MNWQPAKKQNDYVQTRNKNFSPPTVNQVLQNAQKMIGPISESPRLDAQVLLAKIMKNSRTWLVAHPKSRLGAQEDVQYRRLVARRAHGEPLPYILGTWEFFGRRFQINPSVLIPRAETEHLVEEALGLLRNNRSVQKVLEVGTGSGCIAVSLLLEMRSLGVVATDISLQALRTAAQNIVNHAIGDRIDLVQTDLFSGIRGQFDLVCANLPYIPRKVLNNLQVGRWEPRLALDGGEDGFIYLRRFIAEVAKVLAPGGSVVLEIGEGQDEEVRSMIHLGFPRAPVRISKDLAGHNRVVVFET